MNKTTIMNNVVPKETLRPIQQNVLNILSNHLKQSFGPMGSNSVIKKENALNVYTKDGHTILKNIYFHGIIEQSIKDDIESITRHIVTTVGDGTTSAVMLSALIFDAINRVTEENDVPPTHVLDMFKKAIDNICSRIRKASKECDLKDIYDICMISTNGNEFISKTIADIYEEAGMEVFIDVLAAIDENTTVKTYDGMSINTGFADSAFITDTKKNEAVVDNPRIYFFRDPIDTKEMAMLFDAIISKNIMTPYNKERAGKTDEQIIPTVIVAPKLSRDMSSLMNSITEFMGRMPAGQKLPLLVITDYHQAEEIEDICLLTGGKFIKKYIDPAIMEQDIERGDCPTPDTIQDFCGYCDQVVSGSFKSSFINPTNMKDENGEYTYTYTNLLNFLETELSRARENGEDAHVVGTMKRRIHALKSNLVELSVGGISASDRDALRDLVEDAVLNCRSAALNGVGFGANFMAYKASCDCLASALSKIASNTETEAELLDRKIEKEIYSLIFGAYGNISKTLYSTCTGTEDEADKIAAESIENGCPYNIRTKKFDSKVKSSIESDIIVLETVSKIIGLMATCNQFIVPSPMHNVYVDD